jgi:hypothetical protein
MSITKPTPYTGTVPNRGTQTQTEFDNAATQLMDYWEQLSPELSAFSDDVDETADAINASETAAETAAALAEDWATKESGPVSTTGYSAKHYAQQAAGTANMVGSWGDLSGSLSIPASVAHNSRLYALLTDLADVTASEPGVTDDWVEVSPRESLAEILATKDITPVDIAIDDSVIPLSAQKGTSWYNETLNTAIRGARRELPSVRVIVAETDNVTIFDGDDPSLPLWRQLQNLYSPTSSKPISSVAAKNGLILVGQKNNGVAGALIGYDLVADKSWWRTNTSILYLFDPLTKLSSVSIVDAAIPLVSRDINDVALTTLDDAPIDPRTGLKALTAAVATDGGVSVIKNIGTDVEEVVNDGYGSPCEYVAFTEDGHIAYGDISNACVFTAVSDISEGFTGERMGSKGSVASTVYPRAASLNSASPAPVGNYFGGSGGLTALLPNRASPEDSAVAYITSEYNTGYMRNGTVLAALADTDTTDLVDTELVTNGDFATGDLTGFTVHSDVSYDVSGRAKFTASSVFTGYVLTKEVILEANSTYKLSFSAEKIAANHTNVVCVVNRIINNSGTSITLSPSLPSLTDSSVGSETEFAAFFTTDSDTSVFIQFFSNNVQIGDGLYLDNISVKQADADRSVNGNHLQVVGTVTREPVATGADTVAYSGFSSTDYLYQPYNADLDFGTGDFYLMGWVKVVSPAAVKAISVRACPGTGYGTVYFGLDADAANIRFLINGIAATAPLPSGLFFVAAVRAAGVAYLYVDGQLKDSAANATSVDKDDAILGVGASLYSSVFDRALGNSSQIARLRIGAGSLSADEIRDYYEKEKGSFREGSQSTLYGDSDAVTCLAYDDGLLHVGTSDGRSTFSGLQRVSNTETGITSIAAHGGLIIEG